MLRPAPELTTAQLRAAPERVVRVPTPGLRVPAGGFAVLVEGLCSTAQEQYWGLAQLRHGALAVQIQADPADPGSIYATPVADFTQLRQAAGPGPARTWTRHPRQPWQPTPRPPAMPDTYSQNCALSVHVSFPAP